MYACLCYLQVKLAGMVEESLASLVYACIVIILPNIHMLMLNNHPKRHLCCSIHVRIYPQIQKKLPGRTRPFYPSYPSSLTPSTPSLPRLKQQPPLRPHLIRKPSRSLKHALAPQPRLPDHTLERLILVGRDLVPEEHS